MDDVVGSKRVLGCETLIVWRWKEGLFTNPSGEIIATA